MPDAPITPDERAAMRERYAADLPSAWDTSAAAHARALRDLGTSARNDVPRLLDALDTAEAEVARLRAEAARPAPAWDEEATRVALVDAQLASVQQVMEDGYPSIFVRSNEDAADVALAVVRDNQPVKPRRETVRDEIAGHPIGSGYYATTVGVDEAAEIADAVLSLLPGRSEAEVAAEALRDAADEWHAEHYGTRPAVTTEDLLDRADRLAADGGAS